MSTSNPNEPVAQPKRRFRRLLTRLVLLIFVALAAGVATLPQLLSTEPGRRWLLSKANAALAPGGSIHFDAISLSWTEPTRVTGLKLYGERGETIVDAPRAELSRSLWRLIKDHPKVGKVRLEKAALVVERDNDGSGDGDIDLFTALEPVLHPKPNGELIIEIVDGSLTVTGQGLPAPIRAGKFDAKIAFPSAPELWSWSARLADPVAEKPGGVITFEGSRNFWREAEEGRIIKVQVQADAWPIALDRPDVATHALLAGSLSATIAKGDVVTRGKLELSGVELAGTSLNDHALRVDRVTANWDLDVTSSTGASLQSFKAGAPSVILDPGGTSAREYGPIELELTGKLSTDGNKIEGLKAAITSTQGTLHAEGSIDDMKGARRIDLNGAIEPDWKALQELAAARLGPNTELAGKSCVWSIRGPLSTLGEGLEAAAKNFDARFALTIDRFRAFGIRTGSTTLAATLKQGAIAIDPIDTSLNNGRIHLEPILTRDDKGRRVARIMPGSYVKDAEIDQEVTHRVLLYAAPALDQATRIQGRLSADIRLADFPLDPVVNSKEGPNVDATIGFHDVEFGPGPFIVMLLDLVQIRDRPVMRLNQPIVMTIANRRVATRGMSIPIGKISRIDLEGWVDFDRRIEMAASISLPRLAPADMPILGAVLSGGRVTIPIRGTLDKPTVDPKAFADGMKDLGRDVLGNVAGAGAIDLFQQLIKPRNRVPRRDQNAAGSSPPRPPAPILPDALPGDDQAGANKKLSVTPGTPNPPRPNPPALTPEERRERRLEKKAERVKKRELRKEEMLEKKLERLREQNLDDEKKSSNPSGA
ncbi:MAG: hypothetical protein KGM43_05375 [Planctomycetota bacterium]|nr:hypothetical protein [Planctomycetota bacterium]